MGCPHEKASQLRATIKEVERHLSMVKLLHGHTDIDSDKNEFLTDLHALTIHAMEKKIVELEKEILVIEVAIAQEPSPVLSQATNQTHGPLTEENVKNFLQNSQSEEQSDESEKSFDASEESFDPDNHIVR